MNKRKLRSLVSALAVFHAKDIAVSARGGGSTASGGFVQPGIEQLGLSDLDEGGVQNLEDSEWGREFDSEDAGTLNCVDSD